jgi:hypothetical protein
MLHNQNCQRLHIFPRPIGSIAQGHRDAAAVVVLSSAARIDTDAVLEDNVPAMAAMLQAMAMVIW